MLDMIVLFLRIDIALYRNAHVVLSIGRGLSCPAGSAVSVVGCELRVIMVIDLKAMQRIFIVIIPVVFEEIPDISTRIVLFGIGYLDRKSTRLNSSH